MKMKDNFSDKHIALMKQRIDEMLEGEAGFVFIYTSKNNQITDAYHNVCKVLVNKAIKESLDDAVRKNLIKEKCCE